MVADLVLTRGNVITVDSKDTINEAVAVKGNKIVFTGTSEDAKAFIGESTQVIDLNGRSVVPGFIESHIHSAVMGVNSLAIDCRPSAVSSVEDIKEAVFERAKITPPGEWIRGWGYNDQYLKEQRHPDKWDLDKAAPNHPVMLTRVCNHISTYNSRAIEIAGITNTPEYSPITFTRKNNEISGVMMEEAHFAMFKAAMLTEQEIIDGMESAYKMLIKEGITSVHDSGGYGPAQFKAFQNAVEQEKFKIRLYPMIFSFAENLKLNDDFLKVGLHSGMGNEHFKIGPMKLMIDGSSSGPTAATFEPYACDPNNHGILSHPQELVDEYVCRGQQGDWQITSHAVGDKGVTIIVNAIEKAMNMYPNSKARHRIEHCGMINDELLGRIKDLGIVPISNPIFLYEFGDGYITNYGKESAYRMFTCKSFLDRGIISAGASDCPITFSDPLMGIHLAVNRETQGGQVINPDERLKPMEALRMFTYNGAYASREEDIKGSIEVGKLADLAVLNGDFTKCAPDKIWDMKVDMTILDGVIEYTR
ncbi:MAG: amidohydrolase [Eubacterium sp.]|nr:amidohydrolase [Candidatus Colimonas fimequi]